MRTTTMRRLGAMVFVGCAAFATAVRADGVPDENCDVVLDSRMSVYMVIVAGQPFRNKRYLTFDDAVKLRDVLVSAGECEKAAPPRPCQVKLLAAGAYAIMRDGANFDPYAKLRTLKQANRYASTLVKSKLCRLN